MKASGSSFTTLLFSKRVNHSLYSWRCVYTVLKVQTFALSGRMTRRDVLIITLPLALAVLTGMIYALSDTLLVPNFSLHSLVTIARSWRDQSVRVVTYNIRYAGSESGPMSWLERHGAVIATLRRTNPHLIGMQEVLLNQAFDIRSQMHEYEMVATGRDDGHDHGEMAAIMYLRERFEHVANGTFWLSSTPSVIGSVGWDAVLPRIVTWAKLLDRYVGREILFFNTHWDHVGPNARVESARLMRSKMVEIAGPATPAGRGTGIIVTGDFNTNQSSPEYQTLLAQTDKAMPLMDAYATVRSSTVEERTAVTFHDWYKKNWGGRIDWLLHSRHFQTVTADIDHMTVASSQYSSDHYAVTATLDWVG